MPDRTPFTYIKPVTAGAGGFISARSPLRGPCGFRISIRYRFPLPGAGPSGHGLSSASGSWPMDRLADHLAEIIRVHAKNKRAHIVGLSYGGVVAQALIARHPEVVDKAILSGTSAPLGPLMKSVFKLYVGLNRPLVKLLPASALGWLLSIQFGIPKPHLAAWAEDMKQMDAM